MPPVTPPAARPIKPLSSQPPKRGARSCACYIELPQKLQDRIILFMFSCSLIAFFHALFGLGTVAGDFNTLGDTFMLPCVSISTPSPSNKVSGSSKGSQEIRTWGETRVIVDWHGNYGPLPSATSALISPASIPQNAFLDPTPGLVRARYEQAPDEGSLATTIRGNTPADTPLMFYGSPYDPFQLEIGDSAGRQARRLYPIIGQPRTAVAQGMRIRRFGRCFPGDAACP